MFSWCKIKGEEDEEERQGVLLVERMAEVKGSEQEK